MKCWLSGILCIYNAKTDLGVEMNSFKHYHIKSRTYLSLTSYSDNFNEVIRIIKTNDNENKLYRVGDFLCL